jgi:hypothetical protein
MMPKSLTKLQEAMVATVLAGKGGSLYLEGGEVNSANNLRKRGLITDGYMFQHTRFTQQLLDTFWGENNRTFYLQGLRHTGWLIFHDRELLAKASTREKAATVAMAVTELARLGGA